jgi:hypothetical protein
MPQWGPFIMTLMAMFFFFLPPGESQFLQMDFFKRKITLEERGLNLFTIVSKRGIF